MWHHCSGVAFAETNSDAADACGATSTNVDGFILRLTKTPPSRRTSRSPKRLYSSQLCFVGANHVMYRAHVVFMHFFWVCKGILTCWFSFCITFGRWYIVTSWYNALAMQTVCVDIVVTTMRWKTFGQRVATRSGDREKPPQGGVWRKIRCNHVGSPYTFWMTKSPGPKAIADKSLGDNR